MVGARMNPRIKAARKAGRVMRYHNREVFRPEDVAQHTFNMMNLIMIMTEGTPSQNLMTAALLHDQGEYVIGDIPSPIKRHIDAEAVGELARMEEQGVNFIHLNGSPKLTDWEHLLLKIADNLDGLLRATEEAGRGNEDMLDVGNTYVVYLYRQTEELNGGPIMDIIRDAIGEWDEVAQNVF